MDSQLNLILLGPPGAGKGTQAARLRAEFALPVIATGELLRASVEEGSRLGLAARAYMDAGGLVPDDLIVAIALDRVDEEDANAGFILDGFPRTTMQADALARHLSKTRRRITLAVLFKVSDTEIVRRIAGRRVCVDAGHTYHMEHHRPRNPGRCDYDNSPLIQRDDDTLEVVGRRLEVYHEQTAPLIEYYGRRGLLTRIGATAPPAEVSELIRTAITTR
jgi:adenylate kinase